MKTLSNGSIAVGAPGSWMRLQAAYEHELQQKYETGRLRLVGLETIGQRAYRLLFAFMEGNAHFGDAMKAAAKACGIKPTQKAVRQYLIAAFRELK